MGRSILCEAMEVIADRRMRVDGPEGNFARIAKTWEVIFGHKVTPRQVALCMIGLKFARECYGHWRDNLVDLAGYADCLALIEGEYDAEPDTQNECHAEEETTEHIREIAAVGGRRWTPTPGAERSNVSWHGDRWPGSEHHTAGLGAGHRHDSGP